MQDTPATDAKGYAPTRMRNLRSVLLLRGGRWEMMGGGTLGLPWLNVWPKVTESVPIDIRTGLDLEAGQLRSDIRTGLDLGQLAAANDSYSPQESESFGSSVAVHIAHRQTAQSASATHRTTSQAIRIEL